MLKNGMNYTDKLKHIVYNCQMCGACGVSCNYAMDMEVMQPITEFRIQCVEDGQTSPALDKVVASLRKQVPWCLFRASEAPGRKAWG